MLLKTNKVNLKSKGYYSLSVYKADGTEVLEKKIDNTPNVVTYNGAFALFFTAQDLIGSMTTVVGTGTTEIVRSATSLGSQLAESSAASSTNRSIEVDNGDGTSTITATRTNAFSLGQVVGTISEVGLENLSSVFIAGQLIKDEFGNPTTVTILSDEQLIVSYTLEVIFPNGTPPVIATSIGTGTVTTPTGSSDYTFYQQPLFSDWANTSQTYVRLQQHNRAYAVINSSGNPTAGWGSSTGAITNHNGTGEVTVSYTSQTASPSDFSSTDIKYIIAGSSISYDRDNGLNTTTKIINSSRYSNRGTLVCEFTPALTKTSSDSMTVEMSQVFSI